MIMAKKVYLPAWAVVSITAVSLTWLPGFVISSYSIVSRLAWERGVWSLKMSVIGLVYFILTAAMVNLTLVEATSMKSSYNRLMRHLLAALAGLFLSFTFFRLAVGG